MTRQFDPYTFDYKKYVVETYNLNEMPQNLTDRSMMLDDTLWNHKEGVRIEKELTSVDIFKVGSMSFRVFFEKENDDEEYYILHETEPFVCAEYSYKKISKPIDGIESKSIWNHKWYKGLARSFFEEYILKKFDTAVSDRLLTEKGFKFWKSVFNDLVGKTHKMFVIDYNTGNNVLDIKLSNEMDRFYGKELYKFRFVISKMQRL